MSGPAHRAAHRSSALGQTRKTLTEHIESASLPKSEHEADVPDRQLRANGGHTSPTGKAANANVQ